MRIPMAALAVKVLNRLNSAGFEAYAVGGCVRDSLLGKTPQDWDLCTSAKPEEIKRCFQNEKTILTGEKYGTVTVVLEGEPFEITTFRAETGYSDSRHPDGVRFLTSLREDLARRDFTVNAMAADSAGRVTDCFGGSEDLKNGLIRCVGRPEERFAEDALRMLRALRFAARLDFSVEEQTAAAIHAQKTELLSVAPERLRKELDGLLCGKAAGRILREFPDVLCVLIPELEPCIGFRQYNHHHAHDVWEHTLTVLEHSEPVPAERLAALLHDVGKPAVFAFDKELVGHFYGHAAVSAALCDRILHRLRYDNETVHLVTELVAIHGYPLMGESDRQLRRLMGKIGQPQLRRLLRLRRADRLGKGTEKNEAIEADIMGLERTLEEILNKELCFSVKQLKISGRELMALGIEQGKQVGMLLQMLLTAVIEERVPNEPEFLIEFAQNMIQKMEND